jgi:hypothetical protein
MAVRQTFEGFRLSATTPTPRSDGFAMEDERRPTYDEQAFRYFLSIERERSERSNRPFLLLLVDLKAEPKSPGDTEIDAASAKRLFETLWLCLRDTDFVGWYRSDRVVGAVLTQYAVLAGTDVSGVVVQRVRAVLHDHLPRNIGNRIQVRVYELPPSMKAKS